MCERAPDKQQGQEAPFREWNPGLRAPEVTATGTRYVGGFSVACHEACGLAQRHCRLPRLWRPRMALARCVTWHPGGTLRRHKGRCVATGLTPCCLTPWCQRRSDGSTILGSPVVRLGILCQYHAPHKTAACSDRTTTVRPRSTCPTS